MKITGKRFIDSIFKFKWVGLNIENYWNNGINGHNAVFLNYKKGFENGGEYIKIYCDGNLYSYPNLKIDIYLLNRKKGGFCKRDFLLKTFLDFEEYKNYVENNLLKDVKNLNDTGKGSY